MLTASAARYSTRQPTSRQRHCAHLGRVRGPHAHSRGAHRRRRQTRCSEEQWVGPLWRLRRPDATQTSNRLLGRCTALIWAVLEGQTLVVEQLIAAGAALDVQDSNGYGPCADCIGRTLLYPAAAFLADSLRSSRLRRRAKRWWSSSSSPPARNSMSRTTLGRARVASASAARYSTRQLTSRQVHCAHRGRGSGPHAGGRAAHRRRRRTRCPRKQRVGPLWRLHLPHATLPCS